MLPKYKTLIQKIFLKTGRDSRKIEVRSYIKMAVFINKENNTLRSDPYFLTLSL